MAKKPYTVDRIVKALKRKRTLKINTHNKTIAWLQTVPNSDKNTIGNGSLGKISYLEKEGYRVVYFTDTKEGKKAFKAFRT